MKQSLEFVSYKVFVDKENYDIDDFIINLFDMDFSAGTDHWERIEIISCQPVFRELAEFVATAAKTLPYNDLCDIEDLLKVLVELEMDYESDILIKVLDEYRGKLNTLDCLQLKSLLTERLGSAFNISSLTNNSSDLLDHELELLFEFASLKTEEFEKFLKEKKIEIIKSKH